MIHAFLSILVLMGAPPGVVIPSDGPRSGPTMAAIRVNEPGPASVMKLEQVPLPVPGAGEILVRVHAAGVNPVDWKHRSTTRRSGYPYTPGFDVSGVVEQTGPQVTRFRPGDAVFAMLDLRRSGTYAEFAIVKQTECAPKPDNVSHVDAAGIPLVALTAWQALFDTADLQPGQTILIHAGAGGVGSAAIQLAKWKGAKVIATASAENHPFLRQLGADQPIDYRTQKFEDLARDVDVVLDPVGGDTQVRSLGVLKKGGILVSIVGLQTREQAEAAGVRATSILVRPNADQLGQIGKLVEGGQFKPVVSQVFPLADAAKAHEQSETRHTRGKIVLRVVDEANRLPATAPATR